MAKGKIRDWQQRVPGYVTELNDIARRAGLAVELSHVQDDDGEGVQSVWRGVVEQFRATGLFNPSAVFPLNSGYVQGCRYLSGRIEHVGSGVYVLTDREALPRSRKVVSPDLELLDLAAADTESVHYGTSEALIKDGVATAKQLPVYTARHGKGKHHTKRSAYSLGEAEERDWKATVFPSGKIRFWLQSEQAMRERIAEAKEWRLECEERRRTPAYRPRTAAEILQDETKKKAKFTPEQRTLDAIHDRIMGCGSLCSEAAMSVQKKIDKMREGYEGSSKLMRAVDDLDIARRSIGDIMRDICKLTGESADA